MKPDAIDRRTVLRTLVAAPLAAQAAVFAQAEGWTPLFNGRDLASWDTYLGKPYKLTEIAGLPKDARGEYIEAVGLNRDPEGCSRSSRSMAARRFAFRARRSAG